jgi:rSAM/selenodomain-associated transferase 1
MPSDAIVLFVKNSTPGRVKTRLAVEVGPERSVEIYRELVRAVCERVPQNCDLLIACDPPDECDAIVNWLTPLLPADAFFFPQCSGDLSARLIDAFSIAFAAGHVRVAAIGSDCVEINHETFFETWRALETHDCVIGPSADGGYYLLALKKPCPGLFQDIAWSSAETFQHTMERAVELQLSVHLLRKLNDVDTLKDWKVAERLLSESV